MRWIVYSNLYIAFCAASLTAATYTLLGQPPRFDVLAGLVFCCTLVIYNLDRLIEPYPGDTEHERWVRRYHKPLWALTLTAAVVSMAFVSQLPSAVLYSLLPMGAISVGYCVPAVRYRGRWLRLKALPGAKLILIAVVWAYATTLLPMLTAGVNVDMKSSTLLLARLLFLASVALPFDLPDAPRDREAGIVTLPTLLGVRATKWIAVSLACLAAATGLLLPSPGGWAFAGSCICAAGVAMMLRPDRGVGYFMVALDGMLLVQAGALWISSS